MRTLPTQLQDLLDTGATTLARCWLLSRTDGVELGFTDHDRPLFFDGVTFEPDSGFTPTATELATGLSADTHDVAGVLSSARITEVDIAKDLYDRAEVTLYLVDWTNPTARLILSRGLIGEIRHGETAFEAEVTGLSDLLSQPLGRAYLHSCSCRLGDPKCGIDLTLAANLGTGTVSAVTDPQQFTASGLSGFADGWFTGGTVTWLAGANTGLTGHVKVHVPAGADALVETWLAPVFTISPGDSFEITAGCDKTAATCAAKFGNLVNFRGFPHIPGDDVAAGYPNSGGAHDGGSLFGS